MSREHRVIAVIDDDPGVRKALKRLLSAFGYRTETFASGHEFLSAAMTRKLACAVVDIDLGDVSGLELVRQFFVKGVRFPVVFVTGSEDDMIRRQAMDLGCTAYLTKPIPAAYLIQAIKDATGATLEKDVTAST
jgi:FixJ family two-component response regulator